MVFGALLSKFTAAVEGNDPEGLAALFLPDGVYEDGFYGAFAGRAAIAEMLRGHFYGAAKSFKWEMRDPVCDARVGYAYWLFSYVSVLPGAAGGRCVFEGISRFELEGGLIRRYSEVFDRGVALTQLGFAPDRMAKTLHRAAERLREREDVAGHLRGPG